MYCVWGEVVVVVQMRGVGWGGESFYNFDKDKLGVNIDNIYICFAYLISIQLFAMLGNFAWLSSADFFKN